MVTTIGRTSLRHPAEPRRQAKPARSVHCGQRFTCLKCLARHGLHRREPESPSPPETDHRYPTPPRSPGSNRARPAPSPAAERPAPPLCERSSAAPLAPTPAGLPSSRSRTSPTPAAVPAATPPSCDVTTPLVGSALLDPSRITPSVVVYVNSTAPIGSMLSQCLKWRVWPMPWPGWNQVSSGSTSNSREETSFSSDVKFSTTAVNM